MISGNDGLPPGFPSDRKLELSFPCKWSYTVIGRDEASVVAVVRRVVGGIAHRISFSNESRSGKYRSYSLEVTVSSDEERLRIFRELGADPAILYTI